MKTTAVIASVLSIAGLVLGNGIASEQRLSDAPRDYQPSGDVVRAPNSLHDVVSALAAGKDAMQPLRGPRSENHAEKDELVAPIAGFDCYVDRIASYVSCYSRTMDSQEAETLVTRLIEELQSALPSERWKEGTKQAGTAAVRSYSFQDRQSGAHINIDVIDRLGLRGQSSYMVSLFGWAR